AEDLRRKDPVKRAVWAGVIIVCGVLVWSSSLQVKVMTQNGKVSRLEASLGSRTNSYQQVLKDKKQLGDATEKMEALNKLSIKRLMRAKLMDALQHTSVEGIQPTRVRVEQSFEVTPAVKAADNKPGRPASSTERTLLVLEAKDTSANPGGDQVNK